MGRWSLESARQTLALTRSQMAAALKVERGEYLQLERAGDDLPPDVEERVMRLLEGRVEGALFRAEEGSQFLRVERGVVGQALRGSAVLGGTLGGAVIVWSGRLGLGLLIIAAGLIALPFAGQKMMCRSCGAPVGLLSILRRRCSACGSSVKSAKRSRNLS